ncbi:unnamed protein product, partial [Didymodactylos carnosus]
MNDTDSVDMSSGEESESIDLIGSNLNERMSVSLEMRVVPSDVPISEELSQFDSSRFAQELFLKAGTHDFETCLHQHWRHYVPLCYTYHSNLVEGMMELNAESILFRPLEIFLYGNEDMENAVQTITALNNPPTVCGHLFKPEEPTYFCRDCCVDSTCVLCTECFLQSEHRKHRYKMSMSGGGGYCDCGDKEAWKQDVHCNLHKPSINQEQDNDNILERLPIQLKNRARQLFEVLFNFSIQLLCCEAYENIPTTLREVVQIDIDNQYVTMVFNDEIHTYDQVISVLTQSIFCSKQEGREYASTVDREGRSAVKCGNFEQCLEVKQMILQKTVDVPLKCLV